MKRFTSLIASLVLALASVIATAPAASASTQTVGFRAGPWRCPSGVYGVSKVSVTGTTSAPSANALWNGPSNTQTAYVPIQGIPPNGGNVNVTVTYHCKVKVGIWTYPSPGYPADGTRWVYGTPPQPTYTI